MTDHNNDSTGGDRVSYESNSATFIGNLTDDPTLRFTQGGVPVANLTIANNRKIGDRETTVFLDIVAWRSLAENVAESLRKGDRVIAIGSIKKRSYENKDGQTVWVTEIEADEVSPSLRWARADLSKNNGSSSPRPAATAAASNDTPF